MNTRVSRSASLALLLSVVGCSEASPESSSEAALTASVTGVLALAPKLAFGATAKKAVSGDELNVYRLKLAAGDKITIESAMTSGNADPDFTLYLDGKTTIKSASFTRKAKFLSKSYFAQTAGNYFLGVRAHDKVGAGEYTLTMTCAGGTCAGTSEIAKNVAHIQDEFAPARQVPVKSSVPLTMVKEYVKSIYTTEEAAMYDFFENPVVVSADFFEAGTITANGAKDWIEEILLDRFEGNLSDEEVEKRMQKADDAFDALAALGASFAIDGKRDGDCGASLLVLDRDAHVVYGIDTAPCP